MTDWEIHNVATIYKQKFEPSPRKQVKAIKTIDDYANLLKCASCFGVPAGSILLARDCRRSGRAYLAETVTFPSTNVYVYEMSDVRKGWFYHSWFCSIFYQLNCELASKNHAGTRKMDSAEFDSTFVPEYSLFSEDDIDLICNCRVDSFITLNDPVIRECDRVWAKIISPGDWERTLSETARYLGMLASDREA